MAGRRHSEKAVQYFRNSREEIRQIPVTGGFYADEKRLRRVAGVCWLAVIEAARGFLVGCGVPSEELCTTDAFRFLLAVEKQMDGKLMKHFASALEIVHISVYYRWLSTADVVKRGFEDAKLVVEKLSGSGV